MRRRTALTLVVVVVVVTLVVVRPRLWGLETHGTLLGEALILDETTATTFAEAMRAEAMALWDEQEWRVVEKDETMMIEARRVDDGDFKNSGILLTRLTATVKNTTADALIRFLATPKGFALIDPTSDPADFEKYLARFASKDWHRLEVAEATADLGGFATMQFVVLNAIDFNQHLFCSKSIAHPKVFGASRYNSLGLPIANDRALNTFAVHAIQQQQQHHHKKSSDDDPRGGGRRPVEDVVILKSINFVDLGISPTLVNWIACKSFFQGFLTRLNAAITTGVIRNDNDSSEPQSSSASSKSTTTTTTTQRDDQAKEQTHHQESSGLDADL